MRSSLGFNCLRDPAAFIEFSRTADKIDDGFQSASTEDCFNFLTQDAIATVSRKHEKIARTTKNVLWAKVKKESNRIKEKRIDKLLRSEFKKQDDVYRLHYHIQKFESNVIDNHNLSDSLVNNGETFPIDEESPQPTTKEILKTRLQAEFRIGNNQETGRVALESHRPLESKARSRPHFNENLKDLDQNRTENQKSYSKKFRMCSVGSRSKAGLSTYRSIQNPAQSNDDSEEQQTSQADLKKKYVADVVQSLKSGISLNLQDYTKPKNREPLDLYLNFRQQEAEISSRVIKTSRIKPVLGTFHTDRFRHFELSKTIYNLPEDLQLRMQTYNDFYNPLPSKKVDPWEIVYSESDSIQLDKISFGRPELVESEKVLKDKSQTLTQMVKAVRKVQVESSEMKGFKDLEKARLRERQTDRRMESDQYNQILLKMESLVKAREEKEAKENEMREKVRVEAEKHKLMRIKREMDEMKAQARVKREEVSRINPKMLDKYSSRRVTCINPYKSYWMKCIDGCLGVENLFLERRPSYRGGKEAMPDTPQPALDTEVGYYRVTIDRSVKSKITNEESSQELEPWTQYPEYTRYVIPIKHEYLYRFDFDDLIENMNNSVDEPSDTQNGALKPNYGSMSAPTTRRALNSAQARKRLKNLEFFSLMFSNVDSDISREYHLLLDERKSS